MEFVLGKELLGSIKLNGGKKETIVALLDES